MDISYISYDLVAVHLLNINPFFLSSDTDILLLIILETVIQNRPYIPSYGEKEFDLFECSVLVTKHIGDVYQRLVVGFSRACKLISIKWRGRVRIHFLNKQFSTHKYFQHIGGLVNIGQ